MLQINFQVDQEAPQQLLAQAPEEIHQALAQATSAALERLAGAVRAHTPVGTGLLADSVFGMPMESGVGGIVSVHPPADVYAAPVEYGTLAHFPPAEALRSWVEKKFGLTGEAEIRSAAFRVARAIAKRGTRGHFMFQRAVDTERDAVLELFDRESDRDIQELETR